MTLSTAPSEIQEQAPKIQTLTPEAQERVNLVTAQINKLLEDNHDIARIVRESLDKMVASNLRDPGKMMEIMNGLYEGRDTRLAGLSPIQRLPALKEFSKFMSGLTEKIAQMSRDVSLSNEANALTRASTEKMDDVRRTYANILTDSHPA